MSIRVDINKTQREGLNMLAQFGGSDKKIAASDVFVADNFQSLDKFAYLASNGRDSSGWWHMLPLAVFAGMSDPQLDLLSVDMLWVRYLSLERKSATTSDTENHVLFKFEKFQILLELAYRKISQSAGMNEVISEAFQKAQNEGDERVQYQKKIASVSLDWGANLLEQLVLEMNDFFSDFDVKQMFVTNNFVEYGRNPVMFMTGLVRVLSFISNVTHDETFFQRTIERVHLLIYYLSGSPNLGDVFEAKKILVDFADYISSDNRDMILEAIGRNIIKHKREALLSYVSEGLAQRGVSPEELRDLMAQESASLDMIIKNGKDRVTGLNNLIINGSFIAVYSPALNCEISLEQAGDGIPFPRLPLLLPKMRRVGFTPKPREAIYYYARMNGDAFMSQLVELRESFKLVRAQMRERVEKR